MKHKQFKPADAQINDIVTYLTGDGKVSQPMVVCGKHEAMDDKDKATLYLDYEDERRSVGTDLFEVEIEDILTVLHRPHYGRNTGSNTQA